MHTHLQSHTHTCLYIQMAQLDLIQNERQTDREREGGRERERGREREGGGGRSERRVVSRSHTHTCLYIQMAQLDLIQNERQTDREREGGRERERGREREGGRG